MRVLIPSVKIQARIRELGEQISRDYLNGNLHVILQSESACFFRTDLARAMKRDVFADFMGISTYWKGKTSSGEVKVHQGPGQFAGRRRCADRRGRRG